MDVHATCNCEKVIVNVNKRIERLFVLEKEKKYLENYLWELKEKEIKIKEEIERTKSTLRISRKYNFALKNQLQLSDLKPTLILEVIPESNKLIIKYEKNYLASPNNEGGSEIICNKKMDSAHKFLTQRVEMYKKIELSISHFINEAELTIKSELNKLHLEKQFDDFKFLNEQYLILLNDRSKFTQTFFDNILRLTLRNDLLIKNPSPSSAKNELKMMMLTLERQDQKVNQLENNLTSLRFTYDELNKRKKLTSATEKDEIVELNTELSIRKNNISTFEAMRNLNLIKWKKKIGSLSKSVKEVRNKHLMADHVNCNCLMEIKNLKNCWQLLSGELHQNYNL